MQNTMKATLIVNGKEFPIEINDPKLIEEITPPKKTGYGRQSSGLYWYSNACNHVEFATDNHHKFGIECYNVANYYSDESVAKNNVRADALMRKLRRFAVEHRKRDIEWGVHRQANSYIYYNHALNEFEIAGNDAYQTYGTIYFDSKATAELAVEEFKDELIWYFTEYKDSL